MPSKKPGKRKQKSGFEKQMQDFGEEASRLGEEFGKHAEKKGKEIEKNVHSSFGIIWPLIGSIIGIICFAIGTWVLRFLGREIGIEFFSNLSSFLLANIPLFFLLFLFFGYADFFSKAKPGAYRPISPIITAAGIIVFLWVLANAIIIANLSVSVPGTAAIANFFLEKIFWIFVFFVLLGYFFLVIARNSEKKFEEEKEMAKAENKKTDAPKRLYRSGKEKILGGVCGGIAEYLSIDPVVIRLLWVVGTFISLGTGIILYIIFWIVIPRNPNHNWK